MRFIKYPLTTPFSPLLTNNGAYSRIKIEITRNKINHFSRYNRVYGTKSMSYENMFDGPVNGD